MTLTPLYSPNDRAIEHMQYTHTKSLSLLQMQSHKIHTFTHTIKTNKQTPTHNNQSLNSKKNYDTSSPNRTGSLTSRGSDESKSRRVFGSLLRRHTSFGAPDSSARVYTTTHSTVSTLSHDIHELK